MRIRDLQFDCHKNVAGRLRRKLGHLAASNNGSPRRRDVPYEEWQKWERDCLELDVSLLEGISFKEILNRFSIGIKLANVAVQALRAAGIMVRGDLTDDRVSSTEMLAMAEWL